MKQLALFIFILGTMQLNAQQWFFPEAKWTYTYVNLNAQGYSEIAYIGDSTINSISCHVLGRQLVVVDHAFPGAGVSFQQLPPIYVYENSGIVYFFDDGNWDTLYNCNAGIGERWEMVQDDLPVLCGNTSFIEVIDTGHHFFNGLNLKFLAVDLHFIGTPSLQVVRDTIVEKIGFTQNYFLPKDQCYSSLDVQYGGLFRCYSDSAFSYQRPDWTDSCSYVSPTLSIDDGWATNEVKIWPNPALNKVQISGINEQEILKYTLRTSEGKLIHQGVVEGSIIDLERIQSGLYILEIVSNKLRIRRKIILK